MEKEGRDEDERVVRKGRRKAMMIKEEGADEGERTMMVVMELMHAFITTPRK